MFLQVIESEVTNCTPRNTCRSSLKRGPYSSEDDFVIPPPAKLTRAEEVRADAEGQRQNAAAALMAEAPEIAATVQPMEKKFRTTFTVIASMPKLRGLKAFLEGNHYEYQEVKIDG